MGTHEAKDQLTLVPVEVEVPPVISLDDFNADDHLIGHAWAVEYLAGRS